MEEDKSVNFNAVTDAFNAYGEKFVREKNFDVRDFINFMEEKFTAAGYRTAPKIGEKLNLLIIHDAGIGDFVLQSGAIREIRRLYPAAHITLVVNSGSVALAECCPYVNEIISLEPSQKHFDEMYKACLKTAQKIFKRGINICYAFIHRAWTPFLMYMSGARIRIAHHVKDIDDAYLMSKKSPLLQSLKFFATDFVPMFVYGNHMTDVFFSPLDYALKAPVANRELELWYTPLDYFNAQNILANVSTPRYAFSMGGNEFMKHYPPEKYAELIKMILAAENVTFVIFGAGEPDLKSAQILRQSLGEEIFSKHVIDLTNKINFRLGAAVTGLCDMYIGNDTSAMHIAAAAKLPVLTPNCFAVDLPQNKFDYVRFFSPYHVPSVVVQPKHALDECKVAEPYDSMGCRVKTPHCITQIEPQTLFQGYKILKSRIADKKSNPLFIC